jgi:hypothetical protein
VEENDDEPLRPQSFETEKAVTNCRRSCSMPRLEHRPLAAAADILTSLVTHVNELRLCLVIFSCLLQTWHSCLDNLDDLSSRNQHSSAMFTTCLAVCCCLGYYLRFWTLAEGNIFPGSRFNLLVPNLLPVCICQHAECFRERA